MNSYEWEWLLNKDDTLYFFPVGHSVEGNYKIHFEPPRKSWRLNSLRKR